MDETGTARSGDPVEQLGEAARGALASERFAPLRWVAETESTNSDLAAAARDGAPEQTLIAEVQTAGRGRLGRRWEAAAGSGLLMSVLIRPKIPTDRLGLVSPALGLAVVDAAIALGADAHLAWPNDVIVPGGSATHPYRKMAGALAEAVLGHGDPAVVAGIGVNIDLPDGFTTERNDPVGLAELLGVPVDRSALAADVVDRLAALIERMEADGGQGLVAELSRRCWTVGREVTVSGGSDLVGRAVGLDAVGRLLVVADGVTHTLDAGDVSVR